MFPEKIKSAMLKIKEGMVNSLIYNNYYHSKIDENIVYLESRDGTDFTGNILRIAQELSTGKYGNLKLYVYANENIHDKVKALSKRYNIKIHKILSRDFQATMVLEKAKYIIDHGFPVIENFYSDSLADTPLALCAEKAHLVTKKASTVVDWPDLDKETMGKVKKKIDTGWDIHLKENE